MDGTVNIAKVAVQKMVQGQRAILCDNKWIFYLIHWTPEEEKNKSLESFQY